MFRNIKENFELPYILLREYIAHGARNIHVLIHILKRNESSAFNLFFQFRNFKGIMFIQTTMVNIFFREIPRDSQLIAKFRYLNTEVIARI